jgi:hypothetical protein
MLLDMHNSGGLVNIAYCNESPDIFIIKNLSANRHGTSL